MHRPHFEASFPLYLSGRSSRPCGNRGQLTLRRSAAIFYPPALWATTVDKRGPLWTAPSSAHPMHRWDPVLPSCIPSFTHLPHSPTRLVGVMPFTRPGDGARFLAEQWMRVWRSCGLRALGCGRTVDNAVAALWVSPSSTVCGLLIVTIPHPADLPGCRSGEPVCGHSWDNLGVPRVWTGDRPRICGEAGSTAMNSNRPERRRRRRGRARSAMRLVRGAPRRLGTGPEQAGAGPERCRAGAGNGEGRRGSRSPGAPWADGAAHAPRRPPRQPFLMRFVSSVTWL